ncbi:hypothetical protein BD410DRAFT_832128 [Rickenella mellea]|uniref:Uncharacterized protein n=1 Tax=Rickenella mellea TaxID=50990 RepID=A0A4Y7PP54_9AGAM|nr:hypothetical protein BD410DRAFT_832128 [Rickenella mellea]
MPSANRNSKGVAMSKNDNTLKRALSMALTDDGDAALPFSQASSDDGMMAAIAQQMQVSMEKKKKEKEMKLLQAAKNEMNKLVDDKAAEFTECVAEMDGIYSDFQFAHASAEDDIRKLWIQILEEQKKLQALAIAKYKSNVEREKRREQDHIKAMTHARKACEDMQRLIASLEPQA